MNNTARQQKINDHIQKDAFANYLGAKVEIAAPGHSRVFLTITNDMTNFHGTTHGGIIFSISDMAFAAACNSHGKVAVALNVSICFLKPSYPGDRLVAEAKEDHSGRRTSLYDIRITNRDTGELIAKSQDQAYRMNEWFVPE
ncbi:MAG: hydroxyphenylacetyl-CoA thioesterase PaaI [Proteobacteria bacterium]|nr:hydroxyphenylacetyl-CoA thioesterase PaaI [Pseudomonadota bacterium]MBU1582229.1 hydroxyphenylacetyl-CoA thioesterase PaaI [Pseudomonadota bacterium]MBU2455385.1 hydroxyphenylacetyl-CoA thioesterase PaaI [Pseudomonadota bacterium]MBU2628439.1 hydroxyphenylacetyl-CoA thioesterase PaaI [Pseudomonadota bacterium]